MTREEAKKRLEVWLICGECPEDKQCYDSHLHSTCEYTDYCDEVSLTDAVKVAISALSEIKGDLISRQAVEDITWEEPSYSDPLNVLTEVREKVRALPSVENKGEWIMPIQDDGMSDPIYYQVRCSKCGFDLDPQTWHQELHQYGADKFCPNCGADMRGE